MSKRKKFQSRIEAPIQFLYPTSDYWAPNFPRNTVQFTVYVYHNTLPGELGTIRICVRGMDDTGMERDERLPVSEYDKRLVEIRYWLEHKLPNPVSMDWLRSQGFQRW